MKISIVTDEVSSDLETSLELIRGWNLEAVELRGIGENRFPKVSEFWEEKVPELIKESKVKVAAISPGLFKIPLPSPQLTETRILRWEDAINFEKSRMSEMLIREHLEHLLPLTIAAAKKLDVDTIVCFSFDRGSGVPAEAPIPNEVINILKDAAQQVEVAGKYLALEVEHICWGDNGVRTAKIVERVNNPALRINWDPANAFRSGEDRPFPDGYDAVRGMVQHVHFKDARVDPVTGERIFVVDGVIDWKGQIEALAKENYSGFISVETHARPKVSMAHRSVERLSKIIKEI